MPRRHPPRDDPAYWPLRAIRHSRRLTTITGWRTARSRGAAPPARGQVSDGLFLPILKLLVRNNHTILGFRYVRLDDAGRVIERPADYSAPGKFGNKGVEIDFRRDDDQSVRKLLHFSVNLSEKGLRENASFLAFLASLKGTATLLKATSYMVHKQEFSIIRGRVLWKSVAVLRDFTALWVREGWRICDYRSGRAGRS